ncbi:hypothetical protein CYLTODRAFT_423482 [Cylindrobasidium torrendii FP15055 ss-10]|uniref:F-box domain-containing protein n=1 Tax=Cylindrobasidium torrendii FP15055 ss-10 TaxID=1314674 RepID=A0A0D7BA51_9AGAR|nr:hypothetical protein CYLTODRAFT_423482 [Cylindrobasidium torrendii FP15055 ss-10]
MAVVVSHVCRRWRAVALGLLELWTFVDKKLGSCDEYTYRSNPLPLVLGLADIALENPLPKSTERAHHLVLQLTYTSTALLEILNFAYFPNIRTFSVSGQCWGIPALRDPDTHAIIPFQHRFLELRNFCCSSVNLPTTPIFPSLEDLLADDMTIPIQSALAPSASTLTHITFGAKIRASFGVPIKVVLPVLKTLTLNNTPLTISEWLCTPTLESLRLQEYTQQPLYAIVRAISEWRQEPLVFLTELIVHIEEVTSMCWDWCIPDTFVAFPNVRRVRWDLTSKNTVADFGSSLDEGVWTELNDIAVRVKGEDANKTLLKTMRKVNTKGIVKPY